MIKIGLELVLDRNWLGGVNYYKNLVSAVDSIPNKEVEFILFVDSDIDERKLMEFQHLKIIKTKLMKRFSMLWFLRKLSKRVLKNDILFTNLLVRNKIDILSHSGWLSSNSKIPTLGWIPDFQHIHLPNFFTKKELERRDKTFMEMCRFCTKVIVSSNDALSDLNLFSPDYADKAIVLQFSSAPKEFNGSSSELERLESIFNFEMPYFLLPNQFWAHKNHIVVIEALALLKKQGVMATVLATGNTFDSRQPDFFVSLESKIKAKHVENEFKVLGMVTRNELETLFSFANAIINPSLFEGWSSTVEEAKAFGKKIILSDINIHREQNPKNSEYFSPNNPMQLASILLDNMSNSDRSSPLKIDSIACHHEARENFLKYGMHYQSIVKQVLALHNKA